MSIATTVSAQLEDVTRMVARLKSGKFTISEMWAALSQLPGGKIAFSKLLGAQIPYSGSIGAEIVEVSDGHAVVRMRDRRAVRNHLNCIHAVALINLGELTTGLAVFHALDGKRQGIVTDLRMQYLKKARGTLTATCDAQLPTESGPQDLQVVGHIRNEQGEVVAIATATWKLR